jgi:DNA polymerase-3 subunit delta'
MSLDRILDQKVPKKILSGALKKNILASAYLFYGESGTGKWAMALELAKAINCETEQWAGCDDCSTCQRIDKMAHPDVTVIFPVPSPKSKEKDEKELERYKEKKIKEPYAEVKFERSVNIPVEHIRNLQKDIYLKPFEGKRKVIIIAEAEKMHNSSANSLLKTLEEPPADATLILTTNDLNKLLPTVVSRCQQIRFGRIPVGLIRERLMRVYDVDERKASYLANLAQGSYGRALDLLEGEKETLRRDGIQLIAVALDGKMTPIVQVVSELLERWDRNSVMEMFEFLASAFRDMYVQREGRGRLINSDLAGDLLKLSERFERQNNIERAFQAVDRIRFDCQVRNASQKLGLLSLCLNIKDLVKGERRVC